MSEDSVKAAVGDSLTGDEIKAMLKRRDLIVELFDAKVAKTSEHAVLYSFDTK